MGLIEKMIKTGTGEHRSREKIEAVQKKRLKSLVNTVREKSRFYKELYLQLTFLSSAMGSQ